MGTQSLLPFLFMGYWKSILSSKDTASSKRLVTLVMAGHLIVTSFLVSFFTFYLILYTPKGAVNSTLIGLLQSVLEYDFYIVLAGLGFITGENLAQIFLEKAKALKPAAASRKEEDDDVPVAKIPLKKD